MACLIAGLDTQAEYSTHDGRIDLILNLPNKIYIIELKFNQSAEVALEQIQEREYFQPFLQEEKPKILLGLSFMRKPKKFDITYATKKLNHTI